MSPITGASDGSERDLRDSRASFLITVDTEGDNIWARPRKITTLNAQALPRFQALCERYGLRPTYLANWEMAIAPAFVEFGRAVITARTAEVGMHLHAWNSPPLTPLTDDDYRHQPYLTEYPKQLVREKVTVMTDTLEDTFGVKMVSHRAGRFGLDETYARVLVDAGYRVDCSVTPHVDWRRSPGDPAGLGGPDYRQFPETAYYMDPANITSTGDSPLLQVPLTVMALHGSCLARGLRASLGRVPYVRRFVHASMPAHTRWAGRYLRGGALKHGLARAVVQGRDYVEFMIHSSELMAGGAPWFPTQHDTDMLFADLEALFDASTRSWRGRTLAEYEAEFRLRRRDTTNGGPLEQASATDSRT